MVYVPARGGANKSNRLLLEALAERGHRCTVVALAVGQQDNPLELAESLAEIAAAGGEAIRQTPEATCFTLNRVSVHAVASPAGLQSYLRRQIIADQPDCVLVCTSDPSCLTLAAALDAAPDRVVVLVRNTLHLPFGPDGAFSDAGAAELYRRAAGVVGVSGYVRDYLERWADCPAVTMPISLFERRPYPKLGQADRGYVTLINPCAVKGLPIFAGLARRFPHVQFAAVPSWGTTAEDRQVLARLPNVTLLPPTDQVDELYAQTRILLVPSLWGEARARVVVEALARGIPVLGADVGGISEALLGLDYLLPVAPIRTYRHVLDENAVPEAIVPEQDLGPWVTALQRLLTDPRHYRDLADRAHARAAEFIQGWTIDPLEAYLQERVRLRMARTRLALELGAEPEAAGDEGRRLGIHQSVALQARKTPHTVAIRFGEQELTYAELDLQSDRVAAGLRQRLTVSHAIVGICMERSPAYLVAILGVLKAGAAYLPLDPTYPPERLSVMVREALPQLCVCDVPGQSRLPEYARTVLCDELDAVDAVPSETPALDSVGSRLAYVMYTSGSTGRPKAACLTHANVAHYVAALQSELEVTERDTYLHTASFSFSSSVRQWAVPLCSGATVRLLNADECRSPLAILGVIRDEAVTVWDTLAPVWRAVWQALESVPAGERGRLLAWKLRLITFSGGPLQWEDLRSLYAEDSHLPTLLNIWGNTETIGGTTYRITNFDPKRTGRVPIGKPLSGTSIQLLGEDLKPVAPEQEGEICFSGPTVGRGYLNDAELTAERFLPLPSVEGFGGWVYRTGDLGRLRDDGALEWVGRRDDQVKIRGFRIEVGEIEAQLRQHPGVTEAAVVAHERRGVEPRLVALVVAGALSPPSAETLREFLAARVPEHMVPAQVRIVTELPRLPSGKLDRRAVSLLGEAPVHSELQTPRDDIERRLAGIWSDVLRLPQVGREDSFFALGGHSLLSVIILDRIRREFGRQLPLTVFLYAPTVAGMAAYLRNDSEAQPELERCLVPLQPGGSQPPLFLVHGVGGGVLNYRLLAELLGTDQPCYALQASALAGQSHQAESIPEMASRYLAEIRTVQAAGPYYLGGQSFGGKVAYEIAQQLRADGERVALVALLDTRGPGYPRFRPPAQRLACHLSHAWRLDAASRNEYLRVRLGAVREIVVRSFLFRLYRLLRSAPQTLPTVLQDIGLGHTQASRQYRRLPSDAPLVLFRAAQQPIGCISDPKCGWSAMAQGALEVIEVPGDHVSIVEEPHVRVLAAQLADALQRARVGEVGRQSSRGTELTRGRSYDGART